MDGRYMTEDQWAQFFALVHRIVSYAGITESERIHALTTAALRHGAIEEMNELYDYLSQ